jgi:hypothetical protein
MALTILHQVLSVNFRWNGPSQARGRVSGAGCRGKKEGERACRTSASALQSVPRSVSDLVGHYISRALNNARRLLLGPRASLPAMSAYWREKKLQVVAA